MAKMHIYELVNLICNNQMGVVFDDDSKTFSKINELSETGFDFEFWKLEGDYNFLKKKFVRLLQCEIAEIYGSDLNEAEIKLLLKAAPLYLKNQIQNFHFENVFDYLKDDIQKIEIEHEVTFGESALNKLNEILREEFRKIQNNADKDAETALYLNLRGDLGDCIESLGCSFQKNLNGIAAVFLALKDRKLLEKYNINAVEFWNAARFVIPFLRKGKQNPLINFLERINEIEKAVEGKSIPHLIEIPDGEISHGGDEWQFNVFDENLPKMPPLKTDK